MRELLYLTWSLTAALTEKIELKYQGKYAWKQDFTDNTLITKKGE